MARKLRIEFVGGIYHINNRGNYRMDIFIDDTEKDAFLVCLFEVARVFGWRLHSFVVMRNHSLRRWRSSSVICRRKSPRPEKCGWRP